MNIAYISGALGPTVGNGESLATTSSRWWRKEVKDSTKRVELNKQRDRFVFRRKQRSECRGKWKAAAHIRGSDECRLAVYAKSLEDHLWTDSDHES